MATSKERFRKQLIGDYKRELKSALRWQAQGDETVDAGTAGKELAAGRKNVPIAEYIAMWQEGLTALENGADPELYNY